MAHCLTEMTTIQNSTPTDADDSDPVESMIKKTGCLDLHYALIDCMADHRDWRKCQPQVIFDVFKNVSITLTMSTLSK